MTHHNLHIAGVPVLLDREAAYAILIALSELHGRRCDEIGNCKDMTEGNRLAGTLGPLTSAYNVAEDVAAAIDERVAKSMLSKAKKAMLGSHCSTW